MVDIFSPPPKGTELAPLWFNFKKNRAIYRIVNKKSEFFKFSFDFRTAGPLSRFDHHIKSSKTRGVIYGATNIECCLFECFSGTGIIKLKGFYFAELIALKDLKFLDLRYQSHNNGLSGAVFCGAPPSITSIPDKIITQNWARYFYDTFEEIDGLIWNSANCGLDTIVLNERSAKKISLREEKSFLNDNSLIQILSFIKKYPAYQFSISPDEPFKLK